MSDEVDRQAPTEPILGMPQLEVGEVLQGLCLGKPPAHKAAASKAPARKAAASTGAASKAAASKAVSKAAGPTEAHVSSRNDKVWNEPTYPPGEVGASVFKGTISRKPLLNSFHLLKGINSKNICSTISDASRKKVTKYLPRLVCILFFKTNSFG